MFTFYNVLDIPIDEIRTLGRSNIRKKEKLLFVC